MIKYPIEREFKQLLRNPFLPRLIFIFPCMIILLMSRVTNLEIENIRTSIIDNDHLALSRRLVDKITAPAYLRTTALSNFYKGGLETIEAGVVDVLLQIPGDFEKDWVNGETVHVLVAVSTVNGIKGSLGGSYLSTIINDYGMELQVKSGNIPAAVNGNLPRIDTFTQDLFSPNLDYKLSTIPVPMVTLPTILCGFLPTLNIVGGKETGTIEQVNVTPVGKFTFILAKLIPCQLIGFVVLTLYFILVWTLYGTSPTGHFPVIYFFAIIFVLVVSDLESVISNHSAIVQRAMFVMRFCMLILILMSGLFTPVRSILEWAQWITMLNPLKYFMQVTHMVYLKGSGFIDLLPQPGALLAFALFSNIWAMKNYRESD